MFKRLLGRGISTTLPTVKQRVVSRTNGESGRKTAMFANDPMPVKAILPNERFWAGREQK